MMMLLTMLCISLSALALCGFFFTKAITQDENRPEIRPEQKIAVDPPRFFAGDLARPAAEPRIPLSVLLTQIERHVRLEQAAAETFLDVPTPESLHSPSGSWLVN